MFNKKLVFGIAVGSVLALSGCGSSTPDCTSSDAKKLLSNEIAGRIIQVGAPGFTLDDIADKVSIVDISTTAKNEKLETYNCSGAVTVKFPGSAADNLIKYTSDEEFRNNIDAKLIKDFGEMKGGMIIQSYKGMMLGMYSDLVNNPSLQGRTDEETAKNHQKAVKEAFKTFTDGSLKNPINYSIRPIKDSKDAKFSINWQVGEPDLFNLNATLLVLTQAMK